MNRPSQVTERVWPFAVAMLVIAADRVTKILISRRMSFLDAIPIVPDWLRIIHTENTGAAFGILAEGNPLLRALILLGVSAAVLLVVALALWKRAPGYAGTWTRLGLGFVLGGAAGNLYDRIVHGSVTDFIEVYHGSWSFPAFNVADSAITVGAALLIFDQFRSGKRPRRKAAAGSTVLNG